MGANRDTASESSRCTAAADEGITVRQAYPLLGVLRAFGHDVPSLLREVGIDPRTVLSAHERASRAATLELWRRAEQLAGDDIGLAALGMCDLDTLEMVQNETEFVTLQLLVTASTVRDAFERMARYYETTNGTAALTLEIERGVATLRFDFADRGATPRSFAEFAVTLLGRALLHVAREPLPSLEIWFRHGERAPSPRRAVHHGRDRYDRPCDGLRIDVSELDIPLRTASPRLGERLITRADVACAARATAQGIGPRVRDRIESALRTGREPALAPIAKHLGLSVRHLTRRLREEGTSHRGLVDEVRAALAARRIDEGLPLDDVAEDLGYSDSRALRRAFRRWYGTAPGDYRAAERVDDVG